MTPPEKAAKNHKIKSTKFQRINSHTHTKLDKLKVKKTYKHTGTTNRRDAFL